VTVTRNNIWGNGTVGSPNCGVTNETASLLTLAGNYWGTSTGPGPNPADAACGGPTATAPFATKVFKISVPAVR
jgi:hypothetical protein